MHTVLLRTLCVGLLMVLIAGCWVSTEATVYTKDVREVVEEESVVATNVVIDIEMPSMESCNNLQGNMEKIVSDFIRGFEVRGCHREVFDTYMSANAIVPLYHHSGTAPHNDIPAQNLFGLPVLHNSENSETLIGMSVDMDHLKSIEDEVKRVEMFAESIDFTESRITVEIINDVEQTFYLWVPDTWVNGSPYIRAELNLEYRDRRTLRPSDVVHAALPYDGTVWLFMLHWSEVEN